MGETYPAQANRVPAWAAALLYLTAAVLGVVGLAMLVGGILLARLGGSPYYLVAGGAIVMSAVLMLRRHVLGIWLYWVTVGGSIVWAVWEVGFHAWLLLPRLLVLTLAGLWLLLPWTRLLFAGKIGRPSTAPKVLAGALIATLAGFLLHAAVGPASSADPRFQAGWGAFPAAWRFAQGTGDNPANWRFWGRDAGGSRYSPLDQITPANVGQLTVAWTANVGSWPGMIGTPIKIDDTVYACNDSNELAAIDAASGRSRWNFDATGGRHGLGCRGVAYYRTAATAKRCAERIFTANANSQLIAIDARTGRLCPGFGAGGVVDLREGLSRAPLGYYRVTSAPTIARGKIVVGGWISDGQYWGEPSGVVRAFDAVTGRLAWAWDMGRPDRTGAPPAGQTYTPGTPNSWAPMSADDTLGLVYVPTGNPTPDYFGAQRRPFDDKYSSSVVALDAETGRVRWSFQTLHHDLWDRDVPAQPTLVDLPVGGSVQHALVQPTKGGEIFVLDRITGRPIFPVTETPMPSRGGVPEERPAPTQPLSDALPSFRGPRLREADMWGVTPLDQLYCRIEYRKARYDSDYTHPGVTPSILYPSSFGAINWGSATIDPVHGVMFVNSNRLATYLHLITRAESDARGLKPQGNWGSAMEVGGGVPQLGTPYGAAVKFWLSPIGAPCNAPPYGHLSAIDLASGKLLWSHPFGTAKGSAPLGLPQPFPLPMGALNHGGSVVTGSGLLFIGASKDGYIRALDVRTGRELWKSALPGSGQSTPIVYSIGGRQFVVIAAGGSAALQVKLGTMLVAYALPVDPK